MVYIGCRDKHVYALNAATGGVRWKTLTGGAIQSSPTVSGGMVYINSNGDGLYVLDAATGAVSRRARGGSFNLSPAVSNGIIYNGGEKHMFALRAG
jgi:eukaryotic-like serine/threonine-protein kinase